MATQSKTYTLKIKYANEDFTKELFQDVKFVSVMNLNNNTIKWSVELPEHIYQAVLDTDEKYPAEPVKNYPFPDKPAFSKKLRADGFTELKAKFVEVCHDALWSKKKETVETEKLIAIRYSSGSIKKRDPFNHASMGNLTTSSFQFFVVYKELHSAKGFMSMIPKRIYKSTERVGGANFTNQNERKWHYYGADGLNGFNLIPWTQEREDFLKKIEDNLDQVFTRLNAFLGNMSDKKLDLLMNDSKFLKLTAGA